MVLYVCVLIVFSLYWESLKLILAMNPFPRWFCHTYRITELVFVLSYIRSRVWGSIEYSGNRCGNYYLIPWRLTALIRWKILDNAVDEVLEALSVHVAPSAIRIVVLPAGVIVLLGLRNLPHSWTGTVGPSLPGFTIAPCVDSLLCYRLIRWSKSIL
jgi:hypothetical protein